MSLSGLPLVPVAPGGLSGISRPSVRREPTFERCLTHLRCRPLYRPVGRPEMEFDNEFAADLAEPPGDDRAEFNLGGGARWVQVTPTDDQEWGNGK